VSTAVDVFVCVDVPDLDAGVAFYADGLGLGPARRYGGAFAELSGGSVPLHLLPQPTGTAPCAGGVRHYGRHWTPVHVDLVTADLEAAVERATAAGAVLERCIERRTWNAIAGLADPFGHGFDLVQEPTAMRAGALDVAIDVPDLDAAVAFYVDGLGLTLRDTPTTGEWARLDGAGGTIHLQRTAGRAYTRHWTPVHLDVVVAAIEDAVARARSAGAALEGPIRSAAFGSVAGMADPFGHGFCFVALTPAGYASLDEESTP
jgi:predicted enzyme related to lactoylglutathione lyase